MKYYFLHTQYMKDGSTGILPVALFETKDKAIHAWHNQMTFDMAKDNENVIGTLSLIYQFNGQIELNSYWQKTLETEDPVVTE